MLNVKQKINLYLPRFQPAQLSLEIKKLLQVLAITIGVIVFTTSVLVILKYNVEQQIVEVEQEKEELAEALKLALSQIPNAIADANLIIRIAREKSVLKKKKQVRDYLYQDRIGKGENFTDLVDQLAKQTVEGIWLSKFEVLNKGEDIQLFGYAKTPKQVSKYIEMLGTQESYQGRNFQQIEIKKTNRSWNEFYISTLTKSDALEIEGSLVVGGER